MNTHPHPGDDSEHAFGSGEHLTQVGTRSRGGGAADVEHSGGSHHPHAAQHVVEPSVAGGVLAGGPGGGEATEAGEAEALREVAKGEAALAEEAFGLGAGDPGAEFGLAGDLVNPVQGVEAAQIQRNDGLEPVPDRIQSADHTGTTTERHHRYPVPRAVVQNGCHLVLAAGQHHSIGCVLLNLFALQQVQRGLAACVQKPVAVSGAQIFVADDGCQGDVVIGGQCTRGQVHVVDTGCGDFGGGHPEGLFEQGADAGGQWFGQPRIAPSVPCHRG